MRDNYLEEYYLFLRFPSVSTDDKYKEKLVECANWLVNKLNRARPANRSLYPSRNVILLCGRAMTSARASDRFDLWPLRCAAAENGFGITAVELVERLRVSGVDGQQGPNPCAHSRNSGND